MIPRPVSLIALPALLACSSCFSTTHRLQIRLAEEQLIALKQGVKLHPTEPTIEARKRPAICESPVKSYNDLVCCDHAADDAKHFFTPSSLGELRDAIAQVNANDPAGHEKVRVVGAMHTSNPQLCVDDGGATISLANLDRYRRIERFRRADPEDPHRRGPSMLTVVVDAGTTLRDLDAWLYPQGYTLGYSIIGFRGVTVGGAIATGAHGSSLLHPTVISSLVEGVTLMGWDGKLRKIDWPLLKPGETLPDQYRALAANLGVLGIVARVRLRIQPSVNLAMRVSYDKDKLLWQKGGVQALIGPCDFGEIVWFPRADRIMTLCGKETDAMPEPGANNVLLKPQASDTDIALFHEVMEDTIENGAPLCSLEYDRYLQMKQTPPLERSCCCSVRASRQAVGPLHLMVSSDLTPKHGEMPELDLEIALPLSQAKSAIEMVNQYAERARLCLPLFGIFLRFSPPDSSTLVAHSVSDDGAFRNEPVMFLELVVYAPKERPVSEEDPSYYKRYFNLAKKLMDPPYYGRPHWAKNTLALFEYARAHNPALAARLARFAAVAEKLDPDHRLATTFTTSVGLTTPAQ